MKGRLLAVRCCLTLPASGRGQDPSPSKPSLIDSTYQVTNYLGTETIHLYEENGKLKWDGKLRPKAKYRAQGRKDTEWSDSIDYDKVNLSNIRRLSSRRSLA